MFNYIRALPILIRETGLPWVIYRSLYFAKIFLLNKVPFFEYVFEKTVKVKLTDIYEADFEKIEMFIQSLPEDKKNELIEIADNVVEGKIKAFSSIYLDYGNPIDWHYNPMTQVRADKNKKWYSIPDFDKSRGDIKVFWEPSRFCHFYYLSRSYMLTKDIKYYDAFSIQLKGWIENNKYSYGLNYKCGQEASIRMINALINFSVFKHYCLTTVEDEENIKLIIEGSYKKVLSNFFYAHRCIRNNHTISELAGMIVGAYCCNDQKAINKAYKILEQEIRKQILPDGAYIQNSFTYQRLALQLFEFIISISEKTKKLLSDNAKEAILSCNLLMYQMIADNGDMPNYGSNDGAHIFPINSCGYRDFRPTINCVFSLIKGKRIYENGLYDEEILWFNKKPIESIGFNFVEKKSMAFPYAGLYSLRDKDLFLMIVLRNKENSSGQSDQLHVDLWYKNKNILCDSGSYSYADAKGIELAGMMGHNTLEIDNLKQEKKIGNFKSYDRAYGEDIEHQDKYFKGTLVYNGNMHTRKIEIKDEQVIIEDCLSEAFENAVLRFNIDADYVDGKIQVSKAECFELLFDKNAEINCSNKNVSRYYFTTEPIKQISIVFDHSHNKFKTILCHKNK